MNYSDIQHRFANKQAGRNGRISAGNVRYEGRNYYSYNTVFGQWVDIEKNVVVIFDGSTSNSSSKHKLGKWCFPDDVHVFPLDFGSNSYYGWRNCDLLGWCNDFGESHRMQMIDHYVGRVYSQIEAINGGKSKGLENVSFEAWGYIEELCSLYKDTSVAKWFRYSLEKEVHEVSKYTDKKLYAKEIAKIRTTAKQQRKLAKLLKAGERNVEVLTDALFGEGTFKKYWDYCARFRKAADKRAKIEKLCKRLGIASPYESSYWGGCLDSGLTADQIRKLTARGRLDLHFQALDREEYKAHENERKKLYNKRKDNAYRWIIGFEPVIRSEYSHSHKPCEKVCNMYTGEVYDVGGKHIFGFYWLDLVVSFNYDDFRKSENKEQWISEFYSKCKEVADNRKSIGILKRIKAHTKEKKHSWDDDVYINDDFLREQIEDAETYALVSEFIRKQDKHYADEEAQRRAREIERLRREEEERKEKELQAQIKQEQINEYRSKGIDGCRDLWREHMTNFNLARQYADEGVDDFCYGGNVLLRLNLNKDKVETSKNIRIPVDTCKKMWRIVSKWHENPSCFKPVEIDTKGSGRYTISSYQNDILTAGCHKIAYTEMERMYNEIQGL